MRARRTVVTLSIMLLAAGLATAQTIWEPDPGIVVLGPGDPGTWDAGGRGAATVVFDGTEYHIWFIGTNGSGAFSGIGHATSPDGLPPWVVEPDPVLIPGPPGAWDDSLLFDHTVVYDGMLFHMWYTGGDGSYRQGGYATSPDGSVWTKYPDNPVFQVGPPGSWDEWIAGPASVILDGGTYKVWYTGCMFPPNESCQIGYAESGDGLVWTKYPDPVLGPGADPGDWDQAVGNPSVVFDGSTYHMWYAGGINAAPPVGKFAIGYAYSSDGKHWTKHGDSPVLETPDQFAFLAPTILDGSTYRMWYTHFDGIYTWTSYASSDCCAGIFGDGFETGDTSVWSGTLP